MMARVEDALLAQSSPHVARALDEYEVYLCQKGNKATSRQSTLFRLRGFFKSVGGQSLRSLRPEDGATLYDALAARTAVDTHRNTLAEAKTFLGWCMTKGWARLNPLADVKGRGRRKRGKEQLRIDEGRTWLACAQEYARKKRGGAVAAMVTLLMGLRCSEVVSRQVRDLDDDGRLLWIPESKTPAGRRTLVVPGLLQGPLRELAAGKTSTDLLFGYHDRAWPRKWVQRICHETGIKCVTAHGMRGLHTTLALEAGQTATVVAAALGHESPTTTLGHYAAAGAGSAARQQKAVDRLTGSPVDPAPEGGSGGV